jgi:hypothetical protein
MPPVGFEPTISADERPKTYVLERTATGTGNRMAIRSTYSECVFVELGIQHATRMRQIVICSLSGSFSIFHIIS